MSQAENSTSILVVDDDEDILKAGRLLLRRQFDDVVVCSTPEKIPELLKTHSFDVVLLDMNFGPGESSGEQGLIWLERILDYDSNLVVIMITAHGNVDNAVEAMRLGATDFIGKPWQNEKIAATVSSGVKLHRSRLEAQSLRETNRALQEATTSSKNQIIGDSGQIRDVLSIVERAAPTDANVLILGENGTGKELIARELHRLSRRADEVFLTVDMGSITESLFESELFGHRKGAFTGADANRTGRFDAANGGTIFLDEIGNLALGLQAKLLRVLEERMLTPVGMDKPHAIDVRVIAATNVAPVTLRDKNHFRQDLLFRLNTVEITVPPLRGRRDDILPIANHYLSVYSRKYGGTGKSFSPQAEAELVAYDWPGNVRALLHTIERAVILCDGDVVEPENLQLSQQVAAPARRSQETPLNLEQVEKETIAAALRKHGFNISHAAKELGLTRASLYRRMEKHGL